MTSRSRETKVLSAAHSVRAYSLYDTASKLRSARMSLLVAEGDDCPDVKLLDNMIQRIDRRRLKLMKGEPR